MDVSLSELWEMVKDRQAWRAVIHGVSKSPKRLSNWSELSWTDVNYILIKLEEEKKLKKKKPHYATKL